MALIECEVLRVDEKRRDQAYEEVISRHGPPDGTVVVSLHDGGEFADDTINEVLTILGEVGEIILVRSVQWLLNITESCDMDAAYLIVLLPHGYLFWCYTVQ